MVTEQHKAAFYRAVFGGIVAAILATIAWAATDPKYAVIAGIAGAFMTRFLAEGSYDAARNDLGQVSKADVTPGAK